MKLSTYLSHHKITDAAFGQTIGKERSVVSKYRTGIITPPLEVIALIEKATKRKVSFRDFLKDENAA